MQLKGGNNLKIIVLFSLFWFYRLISNAYYLHQITFLSKEYEKFWTKKKVSVRERDSEIVTLFKKANIKDSYIGFVNPIGFGRIQSGNASLFDNLFVNNKDVVANTFNAFYKAKSVFKRRIKENFNPIFWIECLIYLPKNIFDYLGIKSSSLIVRSSQVFYWFISVFYAIYSDQINNFIQDFLSNLFK